MKSLKNAGFWKWAVKTVASEYLDTMKKREKLLKFLEKSLRNAMEAGDDRLVAYICQTINSILDSYDETRFNEDVQKLKELIRIAKQKAAQGVGAGTPVA